MRPTRYLDQVVPSKSFHSVIIAKAKIARFLEAAVPRRRGLSRVPVVCTAASGTRRSAASTFRYILTIVTLAAFFSLAIDPNGVERDPYHTHTVIGGTLEEQARALADHEGYGHLRGWVDTADHLAPATPSGDGRVCGVDAHHAGGARVFSYRSGETEVVSSSDDGALLAAPSRMIPDRRPVARTVVRLPDRYLDIDLPVPKPPPRLT